MNKIDFFRILLIQALVLLFFAGQAAVSPAAQEQNPHEGEPISIEKRQNIKTAYEITKADWQDGIGKGLAVLKTMLKLYESMDVDPKNLNLHAVFHSKAGAWMLTNEAYNRHTDGKGGNPNKAIIRELVDEGISIELCYQTMKHNGWKKEDILPAVTIVKNAYSRLADLQLQGFAYIKL